MRSIGFNTKIGFINIFSENNKVVRISINQNEIKTNNNDEILLNCKNQILQYLDGKRKIFDCDFLLKGTDFQIVVWNELLKIPYCEVTTYKEIAKNIGRLTAVRAVANAIGRNPLPILVPCHRVIGSDGKLHGYRYGLAVKKKLLLIEQIL